MVRASNLPVGELVVNGNLLECSESAEEKGVLLAVRRIGIPGIDFLTQGFRFIRFAGIKIGLNASDNVGRVGRHGF